MATYLGACAELGPEYIDSRLIGAAQITYLEAIRSIRRAPRRRSDGRPDRAPGRQGGSR